MCVCVCARLTTLPPAQVWSASVDKMYMLKIITIQCMGLCVQAVCVWITCTQPIYINAYKCKIPVSEAGILKIVHCPNTFDLRCTYRCT